MTDIAVLDGLIRGIVIGVVVAAPIGPVNLIAIQRTLTRGWPNGLWAGQGAAFGDMGFAIVAALGLSAIAGLIDDWRQPIELTGAALMTVMGGVFLLSRPKLDIPPENRLRAGFGIFLSTFALTVTNPATLLGFLAIFTGVGGVLGSASKGVQAANPYALILGVYLGSTLWWFVITGITRAVRHGFTEDRLLWINRGTGVIVLGFAGFVVYRAMTG